VGFRVLQEPRNGGLPRTWWASAYTVTWSSRRWASVYECLLETAGELPRISAGCGDFPCVVNQALEYVFTKDKDFQQYLETHQGGDTPSALRIKKPVPTPASKKNGAGNGATNGASPHAASSK